ncbi:MAG: hypothetical protein IJH63_16110 [Methanobrevibacter sp.]|nr:hypothetical protein [Methanobrevibacter sp.]
MCIAACCNKHKCCSAFDLGDLFGTNEKTVNVNGVDFILPDGFKEDTTNTSKEATSALKDLD